MLLRRDICKNKIQFLTFLLLNPLLVISDIALVSSENMCRILGATIIDIVIKERVHKIPKNLWQHKGIPPDTADFILPKNFYMNSNISSSPNMVQIQGPVFTHPENQSQVIFVSQFILKVHRTYNFIVVPR